MRYFLRFLGLALLLVGARASLPPWTANVIRSSGLEAALFRSMSLPDGAVLHVRTPVEARANLTRLIESKPDAELFGFRAREEERGADYGAAEADWKRASLAELADFYQRRNQPQLEVETLLRMPAPSAETFQRALTVASEALLSVTEQARIYDAWIARLPQSIEPYQAYLQWALKNGDRETANALAARLKAAFPQDVQLAVTTDAELAGLAQGSAGALAVYTRSFSPLWPDDLRTRYFQELTEAHQLRSFLAQAQATAAANPNALEPVSQIFFYYEGQKQKPAADFALLNFTGRRENSKTSWTAGEAKIIAALFLRVQDYDESARFAHLLTTLPGATAQDKEDGLADIIALLLEVPEQALTFTNRDLSLYRNIATMDRHPGFLNGILTVALNTTDPEGQYANASQTATSYFHRAAASRLLDKLRSDFPSSTRLPDLEAELFGAYALYGQDEALLRDVPGWLTRNVSSNQYVSTALLLADADVRSSKVAADLALYDGLLKTLADKAGHLPIGQAKAARSPDYARVLDRYVSRLVALHRVTDALALLRREIDRNPDDPGIYERLALFVEQNHLDDDLEQTYQTALAHFKDMSWASKLARVYLRRKKSAAYENLARQIADTFKGTDLAAFLEDVNPNAPTLYRQVNLYAHARFPHNMQFVTNLLHAYQAKPTADPNAYDKLLRENWCNDPSLKTLYLEQVTREGKLQGMLAALPSAQAAVTAENIAALELRAEAQSWLTHFESAAPVLVQLAAITPGERAANERALTIERSLGSSQPEAFNRAVQIAKQDVKAAPADREAVMRTGEILADREQYTQARLWWSRSTAILPGVAESYSTAATVFWDYFQYDDALQTIEEGRKKLKDRWLLAYEAGAIDENRGKYKDAIGQYAGASIYGSSTIAQERLLTLAKRSATAAVVEEQTAALVSGPFDARKFDLRVAVLESGNRRSDLQSLLARLVTNAATTDECRQIQTVASRLGFEEIAADALTRTVAITSDPIEKLTARLELARFYEAHNNAPRAEREYQSLLADEPNRLGVLRAEVDYQWRTGQSQAAVQTLVAASNRAQPLYRLQLKREAAEKAASSGQYAEARGLIDQLIQDDLYNGDYLAEKAAIFAREGDTASLNRFYAATLAGMSKAPLSPMVKATRIAALRRGYILALTTAGQFAEALEQYQLVLNAYPEDLDLADETGRYAEAHGLATRVIAYYEKATHDAPRDYRWPLVLARIEQQLGRLPDAVAAYDKAAYVRPDRTDILLAKADLQLRLLQFADALRTYDKLYELSYHDRQYLGNEADVNARAGNETEAVRLLQAAYIEANPQEASGYVAAMQRTNKWRLYKASDALFQQLQPLLNSRPEWKQQAYMAEVESLTASHRIEDAVVLVKAGIPQDGERAALLQSAAQQAARSLTPAEKLTLAVQVGKPGWLTQREAERFAATAGLRETQAQLLLAQAKAQTNAGGAQALNQLQTSRLLFERLGHELESVAAAQRRLPAVHQTIEREAYQAYFKAGDAAGQQRLINFSGAEYAALFTAAGGDLNRRLYDLAGENPARANTVVQHLLTTASPEVVQEAIASRGRRVSPLWTNSYEALAGLYLLAPAARARQAFIDVLGPRTVSGGLSTVSAKDILRGPDWFYYAGRYGQYLETGNDAESSDYHAAMLELAPADFRSYRDLGDELVAKKQWEAGEVQYQAALQLNPKRAEIYDRLAVVEMRRSHPEAAGEHWRQALQISSARIEEGPLPPEYWSDTATLLAHINAFGAMPEQRNDVDALLRSYIKRNGSYQLAPLLQGLLDGAKERRASLNWVIGLAELPQAEGLLAELINSPNFVPAEEKDTLYKAQITQASKAANEAVGAAGDAAKLTLRQAQLDYIRYLAGQNKWSEVWSRLQAVQPPSERPADLVLKAGALTGRLNEVLSDYMKNPDTTPAGEQTLSVAADLQQLGHHELALPMEEFEYQRELQAGSASAAAYFGLARVRFEQKRNEEGLSLIRRVTWTVGAPFENLKTAATQLEAAGLKSEAGQYAAEWRNAEPWNAEAQLAAARLVGDAKSVDAVRSTKWADYDLRLRAAHALRELGVQVPGADELALLTHKRVTPAEAEQPFAVAARLDAAASASSSGDKMKLYREAIAIDTDLGEARWLLAGAALANHQDAFGLAIFQSRPQRLRPNDPTHRQIEQQAAEAFAQRSNYGAALTLYEALVASEKDAGRKAELVRVRDQVRAKQNLAQLNLSRAPVVTKGVTQHQVVRPKLTSLPVEEVANR